MPPRKKKQPAAIAGEPNEEAQEAPVMPTIRVVEPPTGGYRRAPRYEWIEYRPDELPKDAEGLKVEIRTNLSQAEIAAIPYGLEVKFVDVWPVVAPYVVDWNAQGLNLETGEWEPAPAPAIAGPEVFNVLEDVEALWLILAIKFKHRQKTESAEGKKDSTTSDGTDSS